MYVLLITRLLRLVGRWARKPVNHTSWVALVTPTDRPKSVRNRCLIELFCGVVCVVTCPFDISVGEGAFVIGLGQIASFVAYIKQKRSTEGCSKLNKSGNKTSSGEIDLDIRTHASAKVGQDQVSGGVSVLCLHAAPVANVLLKPRTIR